MGNGINLLGLHRLGFCLTAFALILTHALGLNLDESAAIKLLVVTVLLAGLPHGAIDPIVAKRLGFWQTKSQLTLFSLIYGAIAAAVVAAWVVAPALMLSLLLLFSAWHFSGDWVPSLGRSESLSIGIAILTLPALFHTFQVDQIFITLSGAHAQNVTMVMVTVAPVATIFAALCALRVSISNLASGMEIFALLASAALLTPLWFFLLYFCLLHSPRHLIRAMQTHSREDVLRSAILFTGLTLVAATIAIFLIPHASIDEQLLRLVFVGLFALTVPHMILNEILTADKSK